jgi:hypothetical protein
MTRTVFVPWNQIVVLAPITMQLSDDSDVYRENSGTPAALALGTFTIFICIFYLLYFIGGDFLM